MSSGSARSAAWSGAFRVQSHGPGAGPGLGLPSASLRETPRARESREPGPPVSRGCPDLTQAVPEVERGQAGPGAPVLVTVVSRSFPASPSNVSPSVPTPPACRGCLSPPAAGKGAGCRTSPRRGEAEATSPSAEGPAGPTWRRPGPCAPLSPPGHFRFSQALQSDSQLRP